MATRYIYYVWWAGGTAPLPKNIATATRRIRRADPDAPSLTERGFADELGRPVRWRSPRLDASDVLHILRQSNCNVRSVKRYPCRCWDVDACDRGETRCPVDEYRRRPSYCKQEMGDHAYDEWEPDLLNCKRLPRVNLARTARARKR